MPNLARIGFPIAEVGPDGDGAILEHRVDLIGHDAVLRGRPGGAVEPAEVRMRFAARCGAAEAARRVTEEVEGLYLCGPSGGGGVACRTREVVATASGLLPSSRVPTTFEMEEA